MNKTTKSVLLSALVFPGAGHFYLKKYRTAGLLIITSLASIYIIAAEAIKQTRIVLEEIEASGFAISSAEISELSARAASNANTTEASIASTLILICWLAGIADAFRSGKQADKKTGGQ